MKISLIIPTYNAEPYLPKLIPMLLKQTISFELIIIDSSSTDHTVALLTPHADKLITIEQSAFDHGGTRTIAAKAATGDIVVFITQDALFENAYTLETLCKTFEDPKIAACYGRQLPYQETNLFGKHLRVFNYPDTSYTRTLADKEQYGFKTAFLSDSFAAYKKEAMAQVDWFKDGLILGEDNHIGAKLLLAGYTLAYVSQARVYHSHSYRLMQEFKRYFDIGVFHHHEAWILQSFGKAEGEGKRYIKSEFNYLLQHKAYHKIPEFFIRNGLKYLGYKIGMHYTSLPHHLVPRLSMHRSWWRA